MSATANENIPQVDIKIKKDPNNYFQEMHLKELTERIVVQYKLGQFLHTTLRFKQFHSDLIFSNIVLENNSVHKTRDWGNYTFLNVNIEGVSGGCSEKEANQ